MKQCSLCGAAIADDAVHCPLCGLPATVQPAPESEPAPEAEAAPSAQEAADTAPHAPADEPPPASAVPDGQIRFEQPPAAPPPPRVQTAAPAPGPHYERVLPQQPDGGLTTAQYFWTLMLFAVPVVGLGFMLYWSFGRTASPARRRLARASLIKVGVGIASALAGLILMIGFVIGFARNRLNHFFNYYSDPYRYFEGFDDPDGWYEDFYSDFGFPDDALQDFFTENEPSRLY